MNPIRALGARLKARADSEHEHAMARIVIAAAVLGVMLWRHSIVSQLLMLLAAYLVLALAIFACICVWPAPNVVRRVIAMLADVGTVTVVMFLTTEIGFLMIGVYLFITFGYGFRYGIRYLYACGLLCVAGFTTVLNYAPYWQPHLTAGICFMVALVILPSYVAHQLRAIQLKKARAQQALREYLDREKARAS
ncbi:MAG TPA: hypothetical protein VMQ50_06055 [Casimicrobiaceae bacterium]|nr:hypothetical protein [Casimicrobiaceae bacterium]